MAWRDHCEVRRGRNKKEQEANKQLKPILPWRKGRGSRAPTRAGGHKYPGNTGDSAAD
jgi:hypothetical protein